MTDRLHGTTPLRAGVADVTVQRPRAERQYESAGGDGGQDRAGHVGSVAGGWSAIHRAKNNPGANRGGLVGVQGVGQSHTAVAK